VLGGMHMNDDKGGDDKIVAVCVDDPAVAHYQSLDELPPHIMKELDRFFRDYKLLEGKMSEVGEKYGRDKALEVMASARAAYDRGER
jgi:inorganic pyrophosphatase